MRVWIEMSRNIIIFVANVEYGRTKIILILGEKFENHTLFAINFRLVPYAICFATKKEEETNDYVYMYDDDDKIDQYHIFFL